jgi:hypothetical protein
MEKIFRYQGEVLVRSDRIVVYSVPMGDGTTAILAGWTPDAAKAAEQRKAFLNLMRGWDGGEPFVHKSILYLLAGNRAKIDAALPMLMASGLFAALPAFEAPGAAIPSAPQAVAQPVESPEPSSAVVDSDTARRAPPPIAETASNTARTPAPQRNWFAVKKLLLAAAAIVAVGLVAFQLYETKPSQASHQQPVSKPPITQPPSQVAPSQALPSQVPPSTSPAVPPNIPKARSVPTEHRDPTRKKDPPLAPKF